MPKSQFLRRQLEACDYSNMQLAVIILFLVFFLVQSEASSEGYRNVYGAPLQSCSSHGMALTGYTRNGSCVDQKQNDHGSHHVCIDLSSTTGGNFCQVTGQSDWCSSEMPCHEDQVQKCPVNHWCVCQWAFASYLENAGGCDHIQDIVCGAVNMEAVRAYQEKQSSSSSKKYKVALECLVERCGIDL